MISQEWIYDSSTFWRVNNESEVVLLKPKDTLNTYFITRKVFKKKIADHLKLEKIILTDSKSGKTISESDLYKRKLDAFTEAHVELSYDYKTGTYTSYIIDSTGTEEKIEKNTNEAKKALKYAEYNDLYLCGTSYMGILNKDIPEFPSAKEISKDSAISIINAWTKK